MTTKGKIETEMRRERLIISYYNKREKLRETIRTSERNFKQSKVSRVVQHVELLRKIYGLPRNSAPIRHRNRCWVTGRSRGFYRDFGLSRHVLREMGNKGLIPGVKRSSW